MGKRHKKDVAKGYKKAKHRKLKGQPEPKGWSAASHKEEESFMMTTELSLGTRGHDVRRLQALLNRVGAMLDEDGIFGGGCKRGVEYAQQLAGLPVTGIADARLAAWLQEQAKPFPALSTEGVAFIAQEETGGLAYYDKFARWPVFPGGESGITIGVGFDLRHTTKAAFQSLWGPHLSAPVMKTLLQDVGRQGAKVRAEELKAQGVEIPFSAAWAVFIEKSLPDYYQRTETIYPSLGKLPGTCQAVLVSLVYNRGNSLAGASRGEMRVIQDILAEAAQSHNPMASKSEILASIADQLISMQRLWPKQSGLVRRRKKEARLWLEGLQSGR